jgi:hypothetical protein
VLRRYRVLVILHIDPPGRKTGKPNSYSRKMRNNFGQSQFSSLERRYEAGLFLTDDAVALEALGSPKRSSDIYV